MIGSIELEICTKICGKLSDEKLAVKFPATTLSYSMLKIAHLIDAYSKTFELEGSPVGTQSLLQKDRKRRKRKGEKIFKRTKSLKTRALSQNFDFCSCPSKNVVVLVEKRHSVMLQMPF